MGKKNKQKYKIILCDIDGTLLSNNKNGKISKKLRDTIIKARHNITVGIASGRHLDGVTGIFSELGLSKPCIINGGAQIVNPVTRKIMWEKPILPKDLKNITNLLNKTSDKIWVVDNNKEKLYSKNLSIKKPISFFIPKIQEKKADILIRNLSRYHTLSLNKVVAYHKGMIALHITHAGASKKHAALKLAEFLNVNRSEMIGVGDGYNDFPLFKGVGLKIAVGNAVPELKSRADYVTGSVDDDGVADVFGKFIL